VLSTNYGKAGFKGWAASLYAQGGARSLNRLTSTTRAAARMAGLRRSFIHRAEVNCQARLKSLCVNLTAAATARRDGWLISADLAVQMLGDNPISGLRVRLKRLYQVG